MARKKQEPTPAETTPAETTPAETTPAETTGQDQIAALDIIRQQADIKLGPAVVADYLKHGYSASEALLCEEAVAAIRHGKRAMSSTAVDIGARLCTIKEQTKHGDWTYFVTERAGLGERTARNFMIAARAAAAFPALLDNLENIPAAILYQLDPGNVKMLEAVNKIAASREVEGSDLASVKQQTRPASEVVDKDAPPAPWHGEDWGLPTDAANDQLENEMARWLEYADLVQQGVEYRAAKNETRSGFSKFIRLLGQAPGDFEDTRISLLRNYLSGIYMIFAAIDNEPETDSGPVDGSEIGSN